MVDEVHKSISLKLISERPILRHVLAWMVTYLRNLACFSFSSFSWPRKNTIDYLLHLNA